MVLSEKQYGQFCQYYNLLLEWNKVMNLTSITNFDDVVKYDLQYIDGWSLTLDVKILLRTVWVVFAGKGSK